MHPASMPQRQRLESRSILPWHSHKDPYAALVLEGSYTEAGDGGRRRALPGDLVIHTPFSGHMDLVGPGGAVIVNLPITIADALRVKSGAIADPDDLLRCYARDPSALGSLLKTQVAPAAPADDLPDLLAAALERPVVTSLAQWADAHGVSPRTMTRQFSAAFGIPPAHYRWRARVRAAWRAVIATRRPLADIAYEWGYADQSHMTRAIRRLTGRSPDRWRQHNACPIGSRPAHD